MANQRAWKRPADAFLAGVNFGTWPLQTGETIVSSNARGSLGVTAEDADGADVSASLVEAPTINSDGDQVLFVVKGGDAGMTYWVTVTAPTSDDELLTERFPIEVRES